MTLDERTDAEYLWRYPEDADILPAMRSTLIWERIRLGIALGDLWREIMKAFHLPS